jgi:hypothetical protein
MRAAHALAATAATLAHTAGLRLQAQTHGIGAIRRQTAKRISAAAHSAARAARRTAHAFQAATAPLARLTAGRILPVHLQAVAGAIATIFTDRTSGLIGTIRLKGSQIVGAIAGSKVLQAIAGTRISPALSGSQVDSDVQGTETDASLKGEIDK